MTPTDKFFEWIDSNIGEDPSRLRLRHASKKDSVDIDIPLAIHQIECRRKYASKFPETLSRCPRFIFPNALSAEQATGDRLAQWHSSLINPDERVIDLTAGLGIDDMHIARRASEVTSVERNPELVEALRHNSLCAGITNINPVCADCREYISTLPDGAFDTAFIDPARRADDGSRVYDITRCEPDVIAMLPDIRRVARRLIVKLSPMLDITNTLQSMHCSVTDIYAVGTPAECKELVAIIDLSQPSAINPSPTRYKGSEPQIHALTIAPKRAVNFTFTLEEEQAANATFGEITAGDILFEPYPAIMKAAPFKLLCDRFGTKAISANSHLYFTPKNETTSNASANKSTFPGRAYKVEKVLPYASSVIKRLHKEYPTINITTRNFPMVAPILRKRLSVNDGDPNTAPRLFATTDLSSKPIMIITKQKTIDKLKA